MPSGSDSHIIFKNPLRQPFTVRQKLRNLSREIFPLLLIFTGSTLETWKYSVALQPPWPSPSSPVQHRGKTKCLLAPEGSSHVIDTLWCQGAGNLYTLSTRPLPNSSVKEGPGLFIYKLCFPSPKPLWPPRWPENRDVFWEVCPLFLDVPLPYLCCSAQLARIMSRLVCRWEGGRTTLLHAFLPF